MSLQVDKKQVYENLITNIPGGLLSYERFLLKLKNSQDI